VKGVFLNEERKWLQTIRVNKTINALNKNGFEAFFVSSKEEAISKLLSLVPKNASIGLAGSVTLRELGLDNILRKKWSNVADHWFAGKKGASAEEILNLRRLQINSDVFITSTNAITETGELVNVDGSGQRVSAMIFGPKKVIVISGINKIVKNVEKGISRTRKIAGVMNAKRLKINAPCVTTGICVDCDSNTRICNATTILHRKPRATNITILLVGEELGY
jgi:L-lactate utilization protein LutB